MPNTQIQVCLLTDAPKGAFARNLALLYPDRVTVVDFTQADHSFQALSGYTHVVTLVTHRRALEKLDYGAVEAFARSGKTVVSSLFEYAHARGAVFGKSYVGPHCRPGIRVRVENDVTRGFRLGDVTSWWGKVSGAPNNTHPNQLYQRQILALPDRVPASILGVSTVNGGAVLLEERVGAGRIVAMDLLSPMEPFYDSWGSTNKYLFLGNVIGGSVRYGRHFPAKLTYDQFAAAMEALAARRPRLVFQTEGACSDGRPICSLTAGDPGLPTFLFTGAIHGWEWENAYGLLHLADLLSGENPPEGFAARRCCVKVVPILNPYGYDHDIRHNANGVDLNRNFDAGWEEYEGGEDVYQPWDYDYKGPAPASEPETRVAQGLVDRHRPVGLLDFHTAHYILLKPHRGDEARLNALHAQINARLKDRYLAQRPYSPEYIQVGFPTMTAWRGVQPGLIFYAAEKGTPVAVLVEMSGNRTDTQALVMNVDTVVEICLAMLQVCLG